MPPVDPHHRFVTLVDEHRKILFKIAGSYARTTDDREDLTQEMVLQMWRSFERYDESKPFSTWMYRVCLNVAISFYRSETRRRRVVTGDEALVELAAAPETHEMQDAVLLLRGMLDGLNAFERAIVMLHLDGHAYADIAAILGISESNVGTRINRIKQQLRRDYSGKDHRHGTR